MTEVSEISSTEIDWDGVVDQIHQMIGTNTAIIDKYGIILASKVPDFEKGKLISPKLWDLIMQRKRVTDELGVKSIQSLVLETDIENIVFTFAKFVYIMSKVPKSVDLAKYMPSIDRISSTLDKSTISDVSMEFIPLDLSEDLTKIDHSDNEDIQREKYPIFKHLIKKLTKK
jgi:hypothetical protein